MRRTIVTNMREGQVAHIELGPGDGDEENGNWSWVEIRADGGIVGEPRGGFRTKRKAERDALEQFGAEQIGDFRP